MRQVGMSLKVLIAEDDRVSLHIARKIIEAEGHEVITALNSMEAVALFERERPDLVLLDILMPGFGGHEIARRIRVISEKRDGWVPIIFLSVKGQDEDIVQGIEAGGDDYLPKPIRPSVLAAKIKAMQRIAQMRSELSETNRELLRLSETDGLTGMANRRRFDRYLAQEWDRARRHDRPLGLVLCDVDYFKAYNDHYGHQAGDLCLRRVADALCRCVFRPGDLVARYGGEEFAALLPETGRGGATYVAQAMRRAVEVLGLPHTQSPIAACITVSLGVAVAYPGGGAPGDLIAATDEALYAAKREGRNCVVYRPIGREVPL